MTGEVGGECIDRSHTRDLLINKNPITIEELVRFVGVQEEGKKARATLNRGAADKFTQGMQLGIVGPHKLTEVEECMETCKELGKEEFVIMKC